MKLKIGITETTYKDVYNSVEQNSVEWEEYKVRVWHGKWDEVVSFTQYSQAHKFIHLICRHYHLGHFEKMAQFKFFEFCIELSRVLKKNDDISSIEVARMIEEIGGVEL